MKTKAIINNSAINDPKREDPLPEWLTGHPAIFDMKVMHFVRLRSNRKGVVWVSFCFHSTPIYFLNIRRITAGIWRQFTPRRWNFMYDLRVIIFFSL